MMRLALVFLAGLVAGGASEALVAFVLLPFVGAFVIAWLLEAGAKAVERIVRVRADARLLDDVHGYSVAELSLVTVEAARRGYHAATAYTPRGDLADRIAGGVLEDLEAGNLATTSSLNAAAISREEWEACGP